MTASTNLLLTLGGKVEGVSDVAAPGVHAGAGQWCRDGHGRARPDTWLLEGGGRAPDPLQPPQLLGLHLVADTVQTVFTIFA